MSARAAVRLAGLGFRHVYRYTPGKLDWFAFGLPMEGERAKLPQAGQALRPDVPTCHPTDRLRDVHLHTQAGGWKVCIVVDESGVVLGRLRREAWDGDPSAPVESVMENGPTTFRPDYLLEALVKRMRDKKVGSVLVTNSDGVLLGILYRTDAEQRLQAVHQPGDGQAQPDQPR